MVIKTDYYICIRLIFGMNQNLFMHFILSINKYKWLNKYNVLKSLAINYHYLILFFSKTKIYIQPLIYIHLETSKSIKKCISLRRSSYIILIIDYCYRSLRNEFQLSCGIENRFKWIHVEITDQLGNTYSTIA